MSEEEQIILPDGFKRVEYLESSGTQWIDTSYIPSNNTGMYVRAQQNVHTNSHVMGSGHDGNSPADGFTAPRLLKSTGNTCGFAWGGWTSWGSFGNGDVFESQLNYLNDRKAILRIVKDGGKTYSSNLGELPFTPVKTIYMFTTNKKNAPNLIWNGKIFEAKITEGIEVVKHFIPCLDIDNVPCMYDILGAGTIEENTYYNQGTGKFLTPKDLEWNYPFVNNNYNLPAGFKKCVYLQSDGTQWIDTGIVPNNETGLFCKTIKLDNSNTSMFGVRDSDSTAIMTPYVGGKTLSYRWKAEGKDNIYTLDKGGDYIFSSFLNFYNDRLAKIDSKDTDWITSLSGTLENYTQNIWLFSTNFQGTFNNTYGKYVGRIYRAQITQGANLIHDYVPCLDADNRPCMYDIIGGGTVEDNTYYNQSGGTEFSYCVEHQLPSDFIKLKYLEASGTQYIKTGYVPTNNTGLYVDTYCVINEGTNGVESGVPMSIRETNGNTYVSAPRLGKTEGQQTGYGWGAFTSVGGYGDSRYEGYLNWLNNKKYNVKSPLYAEKVGNLSNLSFTPTFDLCLFGNHNYDGKYIGSGYRIYRAKISEGSEIVRDFVPAFDELKQKRCMYDLINNVAYYNDGEGDFLYNRDYEGTYKGYTGLGCIGNRLGTSEFEWKIPYGYRRVAYLESTGTQYIKTGLKADRLNSIVDFMPFYATNAGSGSYYLGCWNRNSNYQIGAQQYENNNQGVITMMRINNTNNRVQFGIKSGTRITGEINFTEKFLRIGTKKLEMPDLINYPYPNTTVYLFAQNTIGDSNKAEGGPQNIPRGRIYSFKANYDGIPAADYIPCLDPNNKPCMFDIITQQPFYNQGTGEDFTYGII